MFELNRATLIGRVGQSPKIKTLENGQKMAAFSLATNKRWRDKASGEWQQKTAWHDIVCFRYAAADAEKFVNKGAYIFVEGELEYRKYTNKDNIEVTKTSILASKIGSLEKLSIAKKEDASDKMVVEGNVPPDVVKGFDDDIPF